MLYCAMVGWLELNPGNLENVQFQIEYTFQLSSQATTKIPYMILVFALNSNKSIVKHRPGVPNKI